MAIILKNVKINNNKNLVLDSNRIIGVMGENYEEFLNSLKNKNSYYLDKSEEISNLNVVDEISTDESVSDIILKELMLDKEFLTKKVSELSNSEKRLLKYFKMLIRNPSIMIIDEPFLYLDYYYKRKIKLLLKEIVKKTSKTIIIGSNKSEDIYSICEKLLIIKYNKCYYNNPVEIFKNKDLLKEYHIDNVEIIDFVSLCKEKKLNINYTNDIRDLMKEVYKNV